MDETDVVNSTFRLIGVSSLGADAGTGVVAGDGRIGECSTLSIGYDYELIFSL